MVPGTASVLTRKHPWHEHNNASVIHCGLLSDPGKLSLNPTIEEARNQHGRLLPTLAGKKLRAVKHRTNRSDVLDMVVRSGKFRYHWFTLEQRFVLWLTNLPREEFGATDIMRL
jgi:hypothetical protein